MLLLMLLNSFDCFLSTNFSLSPVDRTYLKLTIFRPHKFRTMFAFKKIERARLLEYTKMVRAVSGTANIPYEHRLSINRSVSWIQSHLSSSLYVLLSRICCLSMIMLHCFEKYLTKTYIPKVQCTETSTKSLGKPRISPFSLNSMHKKHDIAEIEQFRQVTLLIVHTNIMSLI